MREYGNSIKDVTGATGARATTGGNPLGLQGSGVEPRLSCHRGQAREVARAAGAREIRWACSVVYSWVGRRLQIEGVTGYIHGTDENRRQGV